MNDKTLSIIIKAQDQASKTLEGVGDKLHNLGAAAMKYAKIAAAALGAAGVAAAGFGIKSAASFEQTRIGLENMLGSADAAKKVLKEVSVFAAQTPFEFPELAGAVKQLVAFGFTGEDAVKTMKQLGDVSAAVGAPMGDIAYLMGTLRTQGRAFTVDIRQFAQRGIPIYEYLAKTMKTTEANIGELIETGKIGFPEVQKAFEAMTSEGGKFHGAMAAQSKSLSGLYSTLKDNVGMALREMVGITQEGDVKAGSMFDRLRTGATALIQYMEKIDWSAVSASIMNMADTVVAQLARIIEKAKEAGQAIADYLAPKIKELGEYVHDNTSPALQSLIDKFKELPFWAQMAISPLATFAASGQSVADFVRSLRDRMVELWDTFSKSQVVAALTVYLQQFLIPAYAAVAAAIRENLMPALGQLWDSFKRLWESLNPGLTVAIKLVAGLILGLFLFALIHFIGVANLVIQVFSMIISVISNVIKWISNLISWFGNMAGAVWNAISAVRNAFNSLNMSAADVIRAVIFLFAGMPARIVMAIGHLGRLLYGKGQELIAGLRDGVKSAIGSVASAITGGLSGALGKLKIPGFANGTSYAPGGLALVGERGPELVNLPRGSQVFTNEESSGMMGSTFNMYGSINLGSAGAVDRFFERLNAQKEMTDYGVGV